MAERIAIGTLGLLMALVWSMALVYQRHNVDLLGAMLVQASPLCSAQEALCGSFAQRRV